ncbi:MAG TPA: glycosyltransferase family 39 protein [Gemmataceae bacterium]|nr:glycosyltransferase family 39 protein [Gemmataceae bacterium]
MDATKSTWRRVLRETAWIVLWGTLGSFWCLRAGHELGGTFDEPVYLRYGLEHWRTGSTYELMRLGTMPLPADVTALPVYTWERWRGQTFDAVEDFDTILPVARSGTLLFFWLMLIYGWRLGNQIAGPWAGRLAVVFLACEPSLLAHASLATTDLALTAMVLVYCYHYRAGRERGWSCRVLLAGVCFGFAILAKASALAFIPICSVAMEWERNWQQSTAAGHWPRLKEAFVTVFSRKNVFEFVPMSCIALTVTFLYCGSDWKEHPELIRQARSLPDGAARAPAIWLAEHLQIFNNAGVGLSRQMQHNVQGHATYILGHGERRAFWYYFPLALSMKITTPLLVLALLCLLLRPQTLASAAGLTTFCLFLFSFTCRVQIGIRLVLPIIALLAISVAAATVRAWPQLAVAKQRRLLATASLAGLILWMNYSAWSACPNGIGFINELWGGSRDGYLLLSDSNYDWGQGLNELAKWQQKENLPALDVWYFGSDPRVLRPPFHVVQIHTLPIHNEEELRANMRGRYLAAGTSVLYGGYCQDPAQQDLFQRLRERTPIARTTTFLIFDMSVDAMPNGENPVRLAQQLEP